MNQSDLYRSVYGEERQKESYKHVDHNFKGKIAGKTYCLNCGLILSNTKFCQWSVDKGCLNKLHSSYQSQRSKTKPF